MEQRRCSQPNCTTVSNNELRKGLCPKHYTRLRRHGDTAIVKISRLDDTPGPTNFPWAKVVMTETCWLWVGGVTGTGYGRLGRRAVHRVVYTRLVGPIPAGMDLDHLCRVRTCVRPDHLEPVTHGENIRRGWLYRETGVAP